jgi:hypothetical protein
VELGCVVVVVDVVDVDVVDVDVVDDDVVVDGEVVAGAVVVLALALPALTRPLAVGVCAYTAWIPAIVNDDTTGTVNAVPIAIFLRKARRSSPIPSVAVSKSSDTSLLLTIECPDFS